MVKLLRLCRDGGLGVSSSSTLTSSGFGADMPCFGRSSVSTHPSVSLHCGFPSKQPSRLQKFSRDITLSFVSRLVSASFTRQQSQSEAQRYLPRIALRAASWNAYVSSLRN